MVPNGHAALQGLSSIPHLTSVAAAFYRSDVINGSGTSVGRARLMMSKFAVAPDPLIDMVAGVGEVLQYARETRGDNPSTHGSNGTMNAKCPQRSAMPNQDAGVILSRSTEVAPDQRICFPSNSPELIIRGVGHCGILSTMQLERHCPVAANCSCDKQDLLQQINQGEDAMGHMGNEAFVIAVTRYFGQSSYITRSMAGLYFGKKGEQVNENGTNLCCAHLPGGGFRNLHDQVKTLIITFLRLAGVEADEESALWMLGKVRNPYMQRYTDAILHAQAQNKSNPEGTIVADFVARDFPVPTQASNDSGLGARTDVLGEVKKGDTTTPDPQHGMLTKQRRTT
ncbi:hypothetical protein THAOC_05037 [Thalassiosira oceanica]|uniref:Uncharacterized protein n=1 Tax=Thalassiosira oceanica TaxID=159749 RepID=K0T6Q0_THAOC|nr:hypothetical protein THAOC_05037 [Thalassiosira oceanica]|eukprot:EJK73345.1 hypothetical protein THAOC_05037 [Thalassiosira oceanica]